MAILKGILKESRAYYLDLDKRLKARLKELPRGSVMKRRIGRKDYFYLKLRDGIRVRAQYLGKSRPVEIENGVKERRLIKKQLKAVAGNLRLLARLEHRSLFRRRIPGNSRARDRTQLRRAGRVTKGELLC